MGWGPEEQPRDFSLRKCWLCRYACVKLFTELPDSRKNNLSPENMRTIENKVKGLNVTT